MIFKIVRLSPLIALIVTSCSTFSPFSKTQSENYNALTYGNDYDRRPEVSGLPKSQTTPGLSFPEPQRNLASDGGPPAPSTQVQDEKASFYGSTEETGDGAVDPTDEGVRNQIEAHRGKLMSAQVRGDRAIRADFYDNSPNDGSLWSNENDANYFFTKGKVRSTGDIISIKMEDPIIHQIAEEIKKSLSPAEQEVEMALYMKNNAEAKDDKDIKAYRNVSSDDIHTSDAEAVKTKMEKSVRWSQIDLSKAIGLTPNEELRAEIIDRYQNGNYKIRAVKRVMYRGSSKLMSVVAVAPASDFDDKDIINSGKLYEHKIRIAR